MDEVLTFEKIWAMFQETREHIEENARQMKETDRRMMETDRQMKETDRQMKETDRKIGKLGNRFGELVEHLVAPSIKEKFNEINFDFDTVSQNIKISDASKQCVTEVDILLENGDIAIAVEVKAKPLQEDVDDHINRIEVLRRRADAHNDTRKFRGAIAGAIMSDSVRNYAHKKGFYVIEQTGDTVKITMSENFIPREW